MVEMRPQGGNIRDPFAWKEALSPAITPAGSARGSARGGSGASTPRSATPPTPLMARSPLYAQDSGSARSSRSGVSARSGHSARAGYPGAFDGLSARTSNSIYATPEPSARTSEFASAYDGSSVCASARNTEFFIEGGVSASEPAVGRRRHKAYAAALDAFASPEDRSSPSQPLPPLSPETVASLDPKAVYSAARHGKHKEVEASLVAGFDPCCQDSFGNTLFHVACQNGNKRIAKLAIKYGGDMDAQNGRGNTGLHFLFAYGYPEIAEYFVEKGAQEHIQNEAGKTAREGIR